jgi:hypothetical protein
MGVWGLWADRQVFAVTGKFSPNARVTRAQACKRSDGPHLLTLTLLLVLLKMHLKVLNVRLVPRARLASATFQALSCCIELVLSSHAHSSCVVQFSSMCAGYACLCTCRLGCLLLLAVTSSTSPVWAATRTRTSAPAVVIVTRTVTVTVTVTSCPVTTRTPSASSSRPTATRTATGTSTRTATISPTRSKSPPGPAPSPQAGGNPVPGAPNCPIFPANNPWNLPVTGLPVAPYVACTQPCTRVHAHTLRRTLIHTRIFVFTFILEEKALNGRVGLW